MANGEDFEIRILNEDDLKDVLDLMLSSNYFAREPLNRGLKTTADDFFEDMKPVIRTSLTSGVSVGALSKQTGELVGMRLSDVVAREPSKCIPKDSPKTENAQKMKMILSAVPPAEHLLEDPQVERILRTLFFTVDSKYTGKGLVTKLIQACHEAAIAVGCQVVYTVVVNSSLQRSLEQLGYKLVHTRELGLLKYQGGPLLHLEEMGDNLTIRGYVKDLLNDTRRQSHL